jgi:hypothetical protein
VTSGRRFLELFQLLFKNFGRRFLGVERVRFRSVPWLLLGWLWFASASAVWGQMDREKMARLNRQMPPPLEIDQERVTAAGIRRCAGQHLILYSDLPDEGLLRGLVDCFDQAVPQWCAYFQIPPNKSNGWCLESFLMQDPERFRQAGLLPADLPEFPTGFNRGHHFWVVQQQPGDYYTRHLLLHEGTHGFMQWFLGGSGPAWYSEGMAEKLGLHRWDGETLELGARLTHREECPYWGRPKVIQDAVRNGQALRLDQVFDWNYIGFQDLGSYAFSWAACEFLERHPATQKNFTKLFSRAADTTPQFSLKLRSWYNADEWRALERDWQWYLAEMDYGIQSDRVALVPAAATDSGAWEIRADQGWQVTTLTVTAGQKLTVAASGQVIVMRTPEGQAIPAEAEGITLHYRRGEPLGKLLVAVIDGEGEVRESYPVGQGRTVTVQGAGRVACRLNDSPATQDDNSGSLTVQLTVGQGR